VSIAVTLTRYAELRAEMESGIVGDDALARARLTPDEWTVAQREGLAKMGAGGRRPGSLGRSGPT
jgi:hypothetical protein